MTEVFKNSEEEAYAGPPGTVYINGEYISVNEKRHVVVHRDMSAVSQQTDVSIPHAEFTLKIKGVAPLGQLVRIGNEQQNSFNGYVPQPQALPYQAMQDLLATYNQVTPIMPIPQNDSEPQSQPNAPKHENKSWNITSNSEPDYQEVPRWMRRASKRTIAATALIAVAIVAGPVTQLAFAGPNSVKVCAKSGIDSILGNPGCFGDVALGIVFDPKNFLNIIPPEQHK